MAEQIDPKQLRQLFDRLAALGSKQDVDLLLWARNPRQYETA
jgi:hypothetical protein